MSVSAIVCAYNEEKTIRPIVQTLLDHPRISEVIVVDDRSTDHTWTTIASIKHSKLVPIRHRNNLGKGAAIATAVRKSRGETLLFVDADLLYFHPTHIDLLISPLTIDPTCMVIGVREPRRPIDWQLQSLLKSFNGERAFQKKQILSLLPRIEKSGYGIEVILNSYFMHRRYPIYFVPLPKLWHVLKQEKSALYQYAKDYLKEGADVLKHYVSFELENKRLERFFKNVMKKLQV